MSEVIAWYLFAGMLFSTVGFMSSPEIVRKHPKMAWAWVRTSIFWGLWLGLFLLWLVVRKIKSGSKHGPE